MIPLLYTRRFLGGRQPLCGTGVISAMVRTFNPIDCTARMALSRPGPGPLTIRSTSWMPIEMAALIACSAARRAAKGVLLRLPLKPADPALPQQTALPWVSVTVTMVLLNDAYTCTCPVDRVRFTLRAVVVVRRVWRTF